METAQFSHWLNETFLDKMLRVIYEFTREDIKIPKGVCYDFCLLITSLASITNEFETIYLWNSVDVRTGENNFVLFCKNANGVMVYDPFNGIYIPIEKYDEVAFGDMFVELTSKNITTIAHNILFGNNSDINKIRTYDSIVEFFKKQNKTGDATFETLKKQNYYERLGVEPSATIDDIKKKFKELIRLYHPDYHPEDENATEKTKLLIEAYACLKNAELRKEYDKHLGLNAQRVVSQSSSSVKQTSTSTTSPFVDTEVPFDDENDVIIADFLRKHPFNIYKYIIKNITIDLKNIIDKDGCKNLFILKQGTNYQNLINIYYYPNSKPNDIFLPPEEHSKNFF